jgi:hypothetical protein
MWRLKVHLPPVEFHKNDAWTSEISLSCFYYHTQDNCCNLSMTWNTNNTGKICFDCIQIHILFLKLNQLLQPHFTAAVELLLHVQSLANLWRPWSISQLCDPVCIFCYHWEKLLVAAFHVWKLQIQSIFTFCNSTSPVLIDYAVLNSHMRKRDFHFDFQWVLAVTWQMHLHIVHTQTQIQEICRIIPHVLHLASPKIAVLMPCISRIWLSAKFKACFI